MVSLFLNEFSTKLPQSLPQRKQCPYVSRFCCVCHVCQSLLLKSISRILPYQTQRGKLSSSSYDARYTILTQIWYIHIFINQKCQKSCSVQYGVCIYVKYINILSEREWKSAYSMNSIQSNLECLTVIDNNNLEM